MTADHRHRHRDRRDAARRLRLFRQVPRPDFAVPGARSLLRQAPNCSGSARQAYEALRAAKEEAEAASRGKSGFLATMSHELRTPLNAIIGFSEMMLREVLGELGNAQYRAYAADIHESGTHLLQIINDILDLSKAEAGKLELTRTSSICTISSARSGNCRRTHLHRRPQSDWFELAPRSAAAARRRAEDQAGAAEPSDQCGQVYPARRTDRSHRPLRPGQRGITHGRRYRHRHRAAAISTAYCRHSSRSIYRLAGSTRAPGSACRWSRRSWTCTAARSCWTARYRSAPA